MQQRSAQLQLTAGHHVLVVSFFEVTGGAGMKLRVTTPDHLMTDSMGTPIGAKLGGHPRSGYKCVQAEACTF